MPRLVEVDVEDEGAGPVRAELVEEGEGLEGAGLNLTGSEGGGHSKMIVSQVRA